MTEFIPEDQEKVVEDAAIRNKRTEAINSSTPRNETQTLRPRHNMSSLYERSMLRVPQPFSASENRGSQSIGGVPACGVMDVLRFRQHPSRRKDLLS